MDRFIGLTIRHRKVVMTIFILAAVVCVLFQMFVKVNYNMADYLPSNVQSTIALEIMDEEFTQSVPNASVMIKNVSVMEAIEYKQKLAAVEGVTEVLWLDDSVDIKQPLEMLDTDTVELYYKNGNALFSVTVADGIEKETCTAIRSLIGEENALGGEASDLATFQEQATAQVMSAMGILLPLIIMILVISTTSWIEPVLFLITIGVSILLNMGTNIIFGEISFITNSVSPILQLAISLDYAIFLLHSFSDYRSKFEDVHTAMAHAVKAALSTVTASAMTTVFGFLALVFMSFQIGADLGLNLAKGIMFSFISTMVFLPALTLCAYKLVDKTQHRKLMPDFEDANRVLSKFALPAVILVLLLIVPSFLGQNQSSFIYGNESAVVNNKSAIDSAAIKEEFGQSTVMVLLVPRGDIAKEQFMIDDIGQIEHVTSVISFANTVGTTIPPEFIDEDITSQFYSENYARIIIYADTLTEGEEAFQTVESIRSTAESYYGDTFYSLGQSANLYDMKNVVQEDKRMVNIIVIVAIFIVLLITFKSPVLPIILLITIESGIWLNLSIPYFTGTSINFLGYLVLSTVQLGATIDYAILLSTHYQKNREFLSKHEAITKSLGETFKSILVSASILCSAGFILASTSTNPAVSDIGLLVGRGTLCSFALVVCFLPAMLTIFDRAIVTTRNRSFSPKRQDQELLEYDEEVE